MEVELMKVRGPVIKAHGKATVDGNVTAEADMTFSVV
jgi:3-hydroxyacyl-[acyl-carrier-protein] dehydratase